MLQPAQAIQVLHTCRKDTSNACCCWTPGAAAACPPATSPPLVGLSKHTLYAWKQRFEAEGPAGLADKPKGLPEEQAAAKRPRGRPRKGGAC
jgi:hypothetical protein